MMKAMMVVISYDTCIDGDGGDSLFYYRGTQLFNFLKVVSASG